jgi:hypothetical protein
MSEEELSKKLILTIMAIIGIIVAVVGSLAFFAPKIGSFFGLFSIHRNDTDTAPLIKPNPPMLTNVPEAVKDPKVSLSGFGQAGSTVILYVNGPEKAKTIIGQDNLFSFPDVDLIDGSNTIFAKVVDTAGNQSDKSDTYTIKVDKQEPKIELTNLKDGDTVKNLDKRITIAGKVDEKATLKINDKMVILKPDLTFEYLMGVNEGNVKLKIEATDLAGNKATKELTVTYQKRSM